MWKWLKVVLGTLQSSVRNQRELALENLALRQQLATLKFSGSRPRLSDSDRLFWVVLSRFWPKWMTAIHIVQPATVIRWHRQDSDSLASAGISLLLAVEEPTPRASPD